MIQSKGRMIRKDIRKSKKFASLSKESQVLFCLLIPQLNSYGKTNGQPEFIKGECCPLIDWLTIDRIKLCMAEINQKTSVKWFKNNDLWYIHCLSWQEHQNLNKDRLGNDYLPSYKKIKSKTSQRQVQLSPSEVEVEVEVEGKEEVEVNVSAKAENPMVLEEHYKQPETPLAKCVCAWKLLQGAELEDRAWDKAHWGRTSKSAKMLLDFFSGDHAKTITCMKEIKEKMQKLERTCTIETVLKHSQDWKYEYDKRTNQN